MGHFHPRRPVGEDATGFFDMEVLGRVGVEAGENGLVVTACLPGFLEDDLRIADLAEHPLEGDMGEHLLPADRTPEELEQCLCVGRVLRDSLLDLPDLNRGGASGPTTNVAHRRLAWSRMMHLTKR